MSSKELQLEKLLMVKKFVQTDENNIILLELINILKFLY